MSRWLLRVGLAVVLGTVAGQAKAQQPGTIQPVVHEMGQAPIVAQPAGQYSSAPCATCGQGGDPSAKPAKQENFVNKCLHSVGLNCAASHNTVGCGSCYGHYIFVFGSCRQFFGEPCIPWGPDTLPGRSGGAGGAGAGGGCSKCGW